MELINTNSNPELQDATERSLVDIQSMVNLLCPPEQIKGLGGVLGVMADEYISFCDSVDIDHHKAYIPFMHMFNHLYNELHRAPSIQELLVFDMKYQYKLNHR
jgi:hypothetical protein